MHYHHIEDIFKSWGYVTFAPLRIKQQIAENIQQIAHHDSIKSTFSDEEIKIIQETKEFLYNLS